VDGLAARRQGISMLLQQLTTGSVNQTSRAAILEKAVDNLQFARTILTDSTSQCQMHLLEGIASLLNDPTNGPGIALDHFRSVRRLQINQNRQISS
jgi:hypothetical protein